MSARLGLLFILFFLLVSISAGAMFLGLRAQAGDALVINLAGRQRMLVQQMTRLAGELVEGAGQGSGERGALSGAAGSFEETLQALKAGGEVRYPAENLVAVPAAGDGRILLQLEQVERVWQEYRSGLEVILPASRAETEAETALASVRALYPELLAGSDALVRLFQERADRRVAALRWIEIAFFGSALLLLGAGILVVRQSILRPLRSLDRYAERIGRGDLQTPIEVKGPAEVELLSNTMERLRSGLIESRQELVRLNQTLETRVAQRADELEALYEVSREISSRLELNHVLQSVTSRARELLEADTACLCLLDPGDQVLRLRALSGSQETVQKTATRAGLPFVQSILADQKALPCTAGGCQETCGILDPAYRASHLASSLWVENRVIGALCVGSRRDGAFADEVPQLLTRLASGAAVAIQNARLYAQAERLAALEERQRIAAAIHDGLAQMIDSLGLLVDQANVQLETGTVEGAGEILERVLERIRQASKEVRQSIANLQEEPPIPSSLQEKLQALVDECMAQTKEIIQWQCDLAGQLYIPQEDARQVLGIAQEALANARRYSGASRIALSLTCALSEAALSAAAAGEAVSEATLLVQDNGCGFDPSVPVEDGRKHFGLKILQARAAQLGGCLQVQSAPGQGTCIRLTWPVQRLALPVFENHGSNDGKAAHSAGR